MEMVQSWLQPELIWFLVGLGLLLAELSMPGLIIFFFGVGAWVVALVCVFLNISLNTQLILFMVSSLVCLFALRSRLASVFKGHVDGALPGESDMEEYVGKRAVVVRGITREVPGRVEFRGTQWDAVSQKEIPEGAAVVITGKDNITLNVEPI